ncbi:uncharacterized protein SOCG_06063 [Schizosaccharomyces octosporus yFS286]|uniref:Uncharacterized protein n=1 Tax=Schizosaccharomyces octosporus (strain yFS286) TaxID=483514 RepID=S9RB24_SCHOY|nr:uncharacterized protein SOCG_06063 [Schizosaccharomyces octosporus yFS286]EPX71339.1 hypothetical protein SOCG_06063 [Schizosaccharomyces octosporus yFS286]
MEILLGYNFFINKIYIYIYILYFFIYGGIPSFVLCFSKARMEKRRAIRINPIEINSIDHIDSLQRIKEMS